MHGSQPILAEQGEQNYIKNIVKAFLHRNLFSSRTIDKITCFHIYIHIHIQNILSFHSIIVDISKYLYGTYDIKNMSLKYF
jgi:hypothetical protein